MKLVALVLLLLSFLADTQVSAQSSSDPPLSVSTETATTAKSASGGTSGVSPTTKTASSGGGGDSTAAATTPTTPTTTKPVTTTTAEPGKPNGACIGQQNCTDPHSTCNATVTVCQCNDGYLAQAGKCSIKAGATNVNCTSNSDCVEHASCNAASKQCACAAKENLDGSCQNSSGAIVTVSWVLLLTSVLHTLSHMA